MWCMGPKVGMGGEHHRYYRYTKFRQNPRGDPKFLVDLTYPEKSITPPTKQLQLHSYLALTVLYLALKVLYLYLSNRCCGV